jgi:hypothetical protein
MRTDFREERKQKIKTAYILASAIQDWHMAEDKSTVCVKVTISNNIKNAFLAARITQICGSPSTQYIKF